MEQQCTSQMPLRQTSSSTTLEENPFESLRSAALTMFHQRTKDLTQITTLQSQVDERTEEVSSAQAALARVRECVARNEAAVEAEEQRCTHWGAQMKEIHQSLIQCGAEHEVLMRAHRTTSQVAELIHASSLDLAELSALLEEATTQRLCGRTIHDFRQAAGDVRRRAEMLRDGMDEVRRAHDGSRLTAEVRSWFDGRWRNVAELAECAVAALALRQPSTASGVNVEAWLPQCAELCGDGGTSAPCADVMKMMDENTQNKENEPDVLSLAAARGLAELAAMRDGARRFTSSVCDGVGLPVEVLDVDLTCRTEAGWRGLLLEEDRYVLREETHHQVRDVHAQWQLHTSAMNGAMEELHARHTAADDDRHHHDSLLSEMRPQVEHYMAATHHGWCTVQQQEKAHSQAQMELLLLQALMGMEEIMSEELDALTELHTLAHEEEVAWWGQEHQRVEEVKHQHQEEHKTLLDVVNTITLANTSVNDVATRVEANIFADRGSRESLRELGDEISALTSEVCAPLRASLRGTSMAGAPMDVSGAEEQAMMVLRVLQMPNAQCWEVDAVRAAFVSSLRDGHAELVCGEHTTWNLDEMIAPSVALLNDCLDSTRDGEEQHRTRMREMEEEVALLRAELAA